MSLRVQSPNFYKGRLNPVIWIVWHSTESSEVVGGAHHVAAGGFAKAESEASAHIVADDGSDKRYPDGIITCVNAADTAWHAKSANSRGYGIELVGRAAQSGVDWTDPYSLASIRNAAEYIKTVPELKHIPARWLTDDQLRRGESGHITHAQVTRVLGGTHTDPGQYFPAAYVMACLQARTTLEDEDDMTVSITQWDPCVEDEAGDLTPKWGVIAVPPVGASRSIPAGSSKEAWLHLRCPNRAVHIEGLWTVAANGATTSILVNHEMPHDTYRAWKLPPNTTQVSCLYSSEVPIAATLEVA